MRSEFHGFYRPTKEEFDGMWESAIIAVDANVLLNLYTYSVPTSEAILALLSEFSDRMWLPHQVALEYHENRCGIILKEFKQYEDIAKMLEEVGKALRANKRHPYLTQELAEKFETIETEIKADLQIGAEKHRNLIAADVICDKLTNLFEGRVGAATKTEELEKIYKEGAIRYSNKIPPGYSDAKKPEPNRYGDLILWYQLIEHAKLCKKPVIFVTDDSKEDWWTIAGDQKVGPRHELRHEFRSKTTHDIYIYSTDQFAEVARQRGKALAETAIKEIEIASRDRLQDSVDERAQEVRLRDPLEQYLKQREMLERGLQDHLKHARIHQDMVEALASANPLEQHLKQREMLERGLQDHLQHARIHQDYLDALSSANPLAQHLKQREMFERSLQDHLKHTHIQ
jgi:hypothetical protein